MRVISCSDRVYYFELGSDAVYIKKDLSLYNKMVHSAYKYMYDMEYNDAPKLNTSKLEQKLKKQYGTSDYFPLSAISEAQGIYKSNKESHKLHIQSLRNSICSMENKLSELNREKDKFLSLKERYKAKGKLTKREYLDEVKKVNPTLKTLSNQVGMIQGKLHNTRKHLEKIEKKMPSCCFGGKKVFKGQYTLGLTHADWYEKFSNARNKRMKITGRRQAKYSNNLFLYDVVSETMTYRVSCNGSKHTTLITFPLKFHHHKDALINSIQLPYNTPGKAVCYELEDYGEYFIIKAVVEVDENVVKLDTIENGVIGIDINVDHIMMCDVDDRGNIVGFKKYEYNLKNKTTNQRLHILRNTFASIFKYASDVGKPIVMEDLDFRVKKSQMMYGDKKYNRMLSSFAYTKMNEMSKSCSYKERLDIIKINPAYTSQIGKNKYSRIKGANVHMCASYVIGRRGMGYKDELVV